MKRFFDWLVNGMEMAAERKCVRRELEQTKLEHEAEKRGLKDAYDRQAQSLQCQLKSCKATIADLEGKLALRPSVLSPNEVAAKMRAEQLGYSDTDGHSHSVLISDQLKSKLQEISLATNVTCRQILSGMVALTWPDKSL